MITTEYILNSIKKYRRIAFLFKAPNETNIKHLFDNIDKNDLTIRNISRLNSRKIQVLCKDNPINLVIYLRESGLRRGEYRWSYSSLDYYETEYKEHNIELVTVDELSFEDVYLKINNLQSMLDRAAALKWWLYLSNEERSMLRLELTGKDEDLTQEQIQELYEKKKQTR